MTTMAATRQEAIRAGTDRTTPISTRFYVWEVPVRLTHWLIVLSIAVLSVTGFYIGRPFIVVPGEARFHFVMGTMKAIHFYFAIVFVLSVLARILWMFQGNYFSRWHQFVPARARRRKDLVKVLRFYLFLSPEMPACTGHNALAGLTYTGVFFVYLMVMTTGLALYSVSAHVDSPMRIFGFLLPILGGPQTARWLHHVGMWLLLGFAVHHVYSAVMVTMMEKNSTVDSIFSGYKYCHAKEGDSSGKGKDSP